MREHREIIVQRDVRSERFRLGMGSETHGKWKAFYFGEKMDAFVGLKCAKMANKKRLDVSQYS